MPLTQIRQAVINEQYSGVVPIGGIVMFSGNIASLPSGWLFCNGSNGTPDLRDKFIIGAAADSSGQANTTVTGSTTKVGGNKDAVAVSHGHTGSAAANGGHAHTAFGIASGGGLYLAGGGSRDPGTVTSNVSGVHSHTITVDNAGESGTDKNLPPYYALAFIMRIS